MTRILVILTVLLQVSVLNARGQTPLLLDLEHYPGSDGVLGTGDDITPAHFEALTSQFSSLGITFTSGLVFQGAWPGTAPTNHFISSSPADATLAVPVFSVAVDVFTAWSVVLFALDETGEILKTDTFSHPRAGWGELLSGRLSLVSSVPISRFTVLAEGCTPSARWCDQIVNVDNIQINMSGPPTPCTFGLSPAGQTFTAQGGTGSLDYDAPGCGLNPAVTSDVPWISVLAAPKAVFPSAHGSVRYTVNANSPKSGRSGVISVGGQSFHVEQAGVSCAFTISPARASFEDFGGTARVVVTGDGSGCPWAAWSDAGWLTLSRSSGLGTGAIDATVASNTGGPRTGTAVIAGQTLMVSQSGGACGALDLTSEVRVTPAGFNWTPLSQYEYSQPIQITGGAHPVPGPLYLVFIGVPNWRSYPNEVFMGAATSPFGPSLSQTFWTRPIPITSCFSSPGDAMVLASSSGLEPGKTLKGELLFFSQLPQLGIRYQIKVLSGRPTR